MSTLSEARWTVIKLRKLRRDVRQTLNLVGGGHRITERPGSWWMADPDQRIVFWTPVWPWKPFNPITRRGLLYLIAHEASHIKWSGRYTLKRIHDAKEKARFHRTLFNAIEDIRVDRLSAREFGGFLAAKVESDTPLWAQQLTTKPEGWSLIDTVGLNAVYAFDNGWEPVGSELALEASKRLWPKLDRIGNLRSSQQVATALEPIYLELRAIEKAEEERKRREEEERRRQAEEERQRRIEEMLAQQAEEADSEPEQDDAGSDPDAGESGEGSKAKGDGNAGDDQADEKAHDEASSNHAADDDADDADGDSSGRSGGDEDEEPEPDPLAGLDDLPEAGADKPTSAPIVSDGDPGTEPSPFGAELEGMAADATDPETRRRLLEAKVQNDRTEKEAEKLADKQLGKRHPPTPVGEAHWQRQLNELRGSINALANRLRAVLRHNALENPIGSQRRGRFEPGKSHRLVTGNFNVFRQPGSVGDLDYTFGILIDVSGSMYSTTFIGPDGLPKKEAAAAFEATVLVTEALERAGLGVFVILWDKGMPHVKPVHEPLRGHRASIGDILGGEQNGGTVESPALGRALEEFKYVRSARKMLICVTDGDTKDKDEAKELLEEAREARIDCVTIRIGGSPAKHWPRGFSVAHANELTRLLPNLINEVVRRNVA